MSATFKQPPPQVAQPSLQEAGGYQETGPPDQQEQQAADSPLPILNVRIQLFHGLFFKIAIAYAQPPSICQKVL